MKTNTVYTTLGGKHHFSVDDARRHAEKVCGEALSKAAHALVALDWKYSAVLSHLDANLDNFLTLRQLKTDAREWETDEGVLVWVEEEGKRGEWKRDWERSSGI
jgi:hypothetical protein